MAVGLGNDHAHIGTEWTPLRLLEPLPHLPHGPNLSVDFRVIEVLTHVVVPVGIAVRDREARDLAVNVPPFLGGLWRAHPFKV